MFKNYLKIAFRNVARNRTFSIVNVVGLAMGMACAMLILLWVQDELSFDSFHAHRDRIYRVVGNGTEIRFFGAPAPLAPAAMEQLPEVETMIRLREAPRFVFANDDQSFYEDHGIIADPAFFEMFTFPFVEGDPATAFSTPFHIVISESMARKYFGTDEPLNKQINIEGQGFLTVGGVVRDVPDNSHLQFDYVLPYAFLEIVRLCGLEWGDFNFRCYLQATHAPDEAELGRKLTELARANGCPQVAYGGLTFSVQSLKEMYLHPVGNYDIPLGNIQHITIFSIIALFILGIACINFINLSTASAFTRHREIGIRKVVGAQRRQLVAQFWGEFILLALVALLVALLVVQVSMPVFNLFSEKHLSVHFFEPSFLLTALGITVFTGLCAGIFPALHLSSYQPTKIFRKFTAGGSHHPLFRRVLVITQFTLSILLIVSTLIVSQQMLFIRSTSLLIRDDLVIHFPIKENIAAKYDVIKAELLENPHVKTVTVKDALPTVMNNNTTGVWWEGKTDDYNGLHMETIRVDRDYFDAMGIDLVEGRYFSSDPASAGNTAYILNETAVRQTGLESPVGKAFRMYDRPGTIIGVVKDTYFQTMHQSLHPQMYYLFTNLQQEGYFGSVFVRITNISSRRELDQVIAHVRSVWGNVNQLAPFEYHFLDETIEAQYGNEQRLMQLFTIFSALAIFISCIGLFGLTTFMTAQRTKEIGIRKVLGASISGIVMMLSKHFTKWVLLANAISWPIAWYAMNRWLQNFAYHISLSWWIFVLSGALALIIALLTVSYQAVRAATANPVESLRYE